MHQCTQCRKIVHGHYGSCPECQGLLKFLKNASYSDSESVKYENLVAYCARQEMLKANIENPFNRSIKLTALFTFPIPSSRACHKEGHTTALAEGYWNKKGTALEPCKKLHSGDPHSQRPDVDNSIKSILDGLNTVLFPDDSLIAEIAARKVWGEAGKAEVIVEEL